MNEWEIEIEYDTWITIHGKNIEAHPDLTSIIVDGVEIIFDTEIKTVHLDGVDILDELTQ